LAKSCDQPILDTYWLIWQYKAGAWPGLITVHRPFDSFAEQCNFGLSLIRTPGASASMPTIASPHAFQAELAQLIARQQLGLNDALRGPP